MKVHNRELFIDLLGAEEPDDGPRDKKKHRALSPLELRKSKAKELQAQKKIAREAEFQAQLDSRKKDAERRARDHTRMLHDAFEQRFEKLVDESVSFVHQVGEAIGDFERRLLRRKERLFEEWCHQIFEPIQQRVDAQLAATTSAELNEKRCAMLESYLTEFNKKHCGLFRDIIIEADYDPLTQQKENTLKYRKPKTKNDPTKNRETREQSESTMQEPRPPPLRPAGAASGGRVEVEKWGTIEATPFGWHANEDPAKILAIQQAKAKIVMKSTFCQSHYDIPKGPEGNALIAKENNIRGKKFPKPVQATNTI